MKQLLLSILLVFSLSSIFAQKNLSNSPTSGAYSFIYKLTDKEAFDITLKSKEIINDSFLHTLVDSFYNVKSNVYTKKLPYGNYLQVSPVKNQLVYQQLSVNNVGIQFINNRKDFQFSVTDLKGNALTEPVAVIGKNKKARYDDRLKLYIGKSDKKNAVVTIKYQGVNNYFGYEEEKPYRPYKVIKRPKPNKYARAERNKYKGDFKYKGYMVFNKPMYKPLDTVKFKAYLVTAKGQLIKDKALRVELCKDWNGPGVVLTTLKPYRDGGYEFSFVLEDSLQLRLDNQCRIVLKEQGKKEWEEVYAGSFRYEDYELKSVNFSVRTDRERYGPNSPVTVYLKATDENDLAVPDGRVEVSVLTDDVLKYHGHQVFVKDSLWKTSVVMDPAGETKLVLPDSIFPKADISFTMNFAFLNSNNESRNVSKSLSYLYNGQQLKTEFKKDSLYLDYLVNEKSVKQPASIVVNYPYSDAKDIIQVTLPGAIKMNYNALAYELSTADGFKEVISLDRFNPDIVVGAMQTKDSLQIAIKNNHVVPFWYTVFSGDKVLFKGFANRLDTTLKHTNAKAAHVKLNYIWGEKELGAEASAFYRPNTLNVELLAPDLIYPGQTVGMQVKVTDVDDKPVAETDVTAYAYTAKFKNGYDVNLPFFGKAFFARKLSPWIKVNRLLVNGEMQLNWDKWGKELKLDDIQYYKFTQAKEMYSIVENGIDTAMAVVAPFVIKDGAIEPVHVVYIDGVPVYFNQAEQMKRYAFAVKPGVHEIKMRTVNRVVTLSDFEFVKGKKTIISIASDLKNSKASVETAKRELSDAEASLLTKYMMHVERNFEPEKALIIADTDTLLLNPPSLSLVGGMNSVARLMDAYRPRRAAGNLLIGPISENLLSFKTPRLSMNFVKEPGYIYTFLPNLLKQKSYSNEYGFSTVLNGTGDNDYKQFPVRAGEIDSIWNEYLDLRSSTITLFYNHSNADDEYGKLVMKLDSSIIKTMPYLKNVIIYKYDEPEFLQIYAGNVSTFNALPKSSYRIIYLFKDNRYFVAEKVKVKARGINYYEWKDVKFNQADSLSINIDRKIKSINNGRNDASTLDAKEEILQNINKKYFDKSVLVNKVTGRVVDTSKVAIPGAVVKLKGTSHAVSADVNGRFEMMVPTKGTLVITGLGYESREIEVVKGNYGDVVLEESHNALNEVVVVGYGVQSKQSLTASSSVLIGAAPLPEGARGSMKIRGISTGTGDKKPLVFVDGIPYSGDVSSLAAEEILSMTMLKDVEATAIYGASAAGGVIIIKTKKGNAAVNATGELVAGQQSMRNNFSDYAIWQPKLFTDAEGKASFKVKFPDDITNWTTRVVAMNGRKQGGISQGSIRSFKTLSANFVSPSFAIEGDSIYVIGKLMNYSNANETVTRELSYNGKTLLNGPVTFKNAKIDTASIVAVRSRNEQGLGKNGEMSDSLSFKYTLKQDNGYFDGELRKIPLMQAGVIETKGYFNALTRDTSITYNFDAALGKVTLTAEASLFPTLLDEIEKLRNYEYLCNEQVASKLKALLLEKKVRAYLGEDFKEEKNIKELLKKLLNNKRPEGTWGWWQNSTEELWISLHVVETLLQAEKQGYKVALDKDVLYAYLVDKMASNKSFDQIYGIKLLHLLNEKYFVKDWIEAIEKQRADLEKQHAIDKKKHANLADLPKQPLYEKLQMMQLRQQAGMPISIKQLLGLKHETMFGNSYWGEEGSWFWDNSIQNTLLAYQILKANGGYGEELDRIQRYFLEQRRDGQWRNTYESSLILQTILPELMTGTKGGKPEPASIMLNKTETVSTFPFKRVMAAATLTVGKKGNTPPVYFTAYQQFNNPAPQKVSKDFTLKTSFMAKGKAITKLTAGTISTLNVEVEVRADADYVMIEVPIPAGCSYENKVQTFWGIETHREYFKHKTSIFCTKLKKGKYNFSIQLMPRYSGNYILNPAKAEMMYFPVFYGREGMKRVNIK